MITLLAQVFLLGTLAQAVPNTTGLFETFSPEIQAYCRADWSNNLSASAEASRLLFDQKHPNVAVLSGVVTVHFFELIKNLPPHIDTLALELPRGGHALSAFAIAELIRAKGLKTYVGLTTCHSACTLLFQAGVERMVNPKALITYHGGSRSSESPDQARCDQAIDDELHILLKDLDFPSEYLSHYKSNSTYSAEGATSALKRGIATKILETEYGRDEAIRQSRPTVHPCDVNPSSEDC